MNVEFFFSNDLDKALRQAHTPYFKHFRITMNDQMMICEKAKHRIVLNRPIILGMCILELSKLHMYNFHYESMKAFLFLVDKVNYFIQTLILWYMS